MTESIDIIALYLTEARELSEQLEQGLLQLEQGNAEHDTIHGMFRAAHTIKGSAGVVGLDYIMHFTHHVEGVLELVRSEQLALSPALVNLLLRCTDHINALLDCANDAGRGVDALQGQAEALQQELQHYLQPQLASTPAQPAAGHADAASFDAASAMRVSIGFHIDTFRHGFDPIAMVRYLIKHSQHADCHWFSDAVPSLTVASAEQLESCYLEVELQLQGMDQAAIHDALEYIEGDSRVLVWPASANMEQTEQLLASLETAEQQKLRQRWQTLGFWPQQPTPDNSAPISSEAMPPSVPDTAGDSSSASQKVRTDQRMMRVPAHKLDDLVNQLGELVIASAALREQSRQLNSQTLLETVAHVQSLVDDLQGCALQLRMVQIGDTFNRFNRVVRDLANELGKSIALSIHGADAELDKSMVELISDPLMHLVRNAIDHGLETSEERLAAGKSAQGSLRLSAYHDSGSIVLEIADDGRGINRAKVLQKARQKGLVGMEVELTDHEIDHLIFAPGFSTADAISNLSGRGVGMDVVKRNIESLRGSIEIDSVPNQGTTFRLRLPLTLAIIDGFMVRVSDSRFVIPLDLVHECIECPLETQQSQLDADVLNLRGEVLPFLNLQHLFGLPVCSSQRRSIVIVRYGKEKAGLVVDQLLGEFQTVIKPLGKLFQPIEGISGSSILGSGDIAFILDVPKLIGQHISRKKVSNFIGL